MESKTKTCYSNKQQNGNDFIADVSVSLPKKTIIDEIDKRIDRIYKHSEKLKGAEKKSYEDTCTSFILLKMWVIQCCTEFPTIIEIDFDGHLKCQIETADKNLKILRAVNGWGNAIDISKVQVNDK